MLVFGNARCQLNLVIRDISVISIGRVRRGDFKASHSLIPSNERRKSYCFAEFEK